MAGRSIDNSTFPGYSKSYAKSLDFKNAGKSEGNVNLQLSGDMLAALRVLGVDELGKIKIGYSPSDPEAGRAEGNQIGSYGSSKPNRRKAREFIGLNPKDLEKILRRFPLEDNEAREEAVQEVGIRQSISEGTFGDSDE